MIPLYSTKQIRDIDKFSINKLGIPGLLLMENASFNIYHTILNNISDIKDVNRIGVVCGKGNNGGDGYATARHFANDNYDVNILTIGKESEMSKDCKCNYQIIKNLSKTNKKIHLHNFKSSKNLSIFNKCDLIIDAMLGTGSIGELREPYLSIVKNLNNKKAIKYAIDNPTGLNTDLGFGDVIFNADLTVTLGNYKKGQFFGDGYVNCGKIEKASIGINEDCYKSLKTNCFLIEPENVYSFLPQKNKNINKYSAGKIFTVAGSEDYPGAALLASKSVMKVGGGASILSFPKSIRSLIQRKIAEIVVKNYDDKKLGYLTAGNIYEFSNQLKWADVISIGPGLGRSLETQEAIQLLLKKRKSKKTIIDADAIFALNNKRYKKINLKNSVLTPHHGEFSNLIDISIGELQQNLLKCGSKFVAETGAYLVLKGAPTIIFTPKGKIYINSSGNPGMAKFGTGDVLTGVIAGLSAQNITFEKAIISAVYIHSLSADILAYQRGELTFIASDILNNIPKTIKFLMDSFA